MKYKIKITIYSLVLLIGVCCFGVGVGSVTGYIYYGTGRFTRWYDGVPMSFSTSVVVMFIGLALYLIGKTHIDDKTHR